MTSTYVLYIFQVYSTHSQKKKPGGDQAAMLFCTDGTRKAPFTEIKLQFCNVIKKKKKLKVAQKYQKRMLFMKSIPQKPSLFHELAFAHPY